MASKASSIQPNAAATSVRRCAEVACVKGKARLVAIGRIVNGSQPIGNRKPGLALGISVSSVVFLIGTTEDTEDTEKGNPVCFKKYRMMSSVCSVSSAVFLIRTTEGTVNYKFMRWKYLRALRTSRAICSRRASIDGNLISSRRRCKK